jgi:hypothetical protein
MAAAVSANSALRLTSGGASFSGAGAVATLSDCILIVGVALPGPLAVAAIVVEIDTGAVKATGFATEGGDCVIGAAGLSLTGLS